MTRSHVGEKYVMAQEPGPSFRGQGVLTGPYLGVGMREPSLNICEGVPGGRLRKPLRQRGSLS